MVYIVGTQRTITVYEVCGLSPTRPLSFVSVVSRHCSATQGTDGVADRVIELSVQIMLEELGPNLWEHRLER